MKVTIKILTTFKNKLIRIILGFTLTKRWVAVYVPYLLTGDLIKEDEMFEKYKNLE